MKEKEVQAIEPCKTKGCGGILYMEIPSKCICHERKICKPCMKAALTCDRCGFTTGKYNEYKD